MLEKIVEFRSHIIDASSNPDFIHHKWFVKWHLEIVEKLARELMHFHPEADKALVEVMVWLHDYGKILDFDNQYQMTLSAGREKLTELGFPEEFVEKAVNGIEVLDRKMEVELREAPIEVQIVSSADGCSHMIGPFMCLWWHENPERTFEQLMEDNKEKLLKDWNRKIVLPEARKAFEARHRFMMEERGELPGSFIQQK